MLNPDARLPNAMSWNEWCDLMARRAARASNPAPPSHVTGGLGREMIGWITTTLFSGTARPSTQYASYRRRRRGMYGPEGTADPHIINPWERDQAEADTIKLAIEQRPRHAPVYTQRGEGFLRTLAHETRTDRGALRVTLTTQATMTPYDPTASGGGKSGTQPIMHYLRHGWRGQRASMRPRWPNGVAPFMQRDKPYLQAVELILRWILFGR